MRIVSLLPSTTEILFAIGAGDDVVGVTFECDFPEQARERRIVSTSALPHGLTAAGIDRAVRERMAAGEDLYHLDAGALAELDADLVVTQDLCAVCAVDTSVVDEALAFLGCDADVLTIDPHRLTEVLESVHTLGAAVGRVPEASVVVEGLRARLDRLPGATAAEPVDVTVLEWTEPLFGPGHWVPDMVAIAGGRSTLGAPGARSAVLDRGDVPAEPGIVVVAPCGYDLAGAEPLARDLLRTGSLDAADQVWVVDANASFARPGPRLVDGCEALAAMVSGRAPDPSLARRLA